jgi:hypothetical protein
MDITPEKRHHKEDKVRARLYRIFILTFQVLIDKLQVSFSPCSLWSCLDVARVTLSPASTA